MANTNTNLIANKVVKDAVAAEFPNQLFFSKLAGVVVENRDLSSVGAGDTLTFTNWDLAPTDLQTLGRGDTIAVNELKQSQYSVTINQLAHGKLYYDADLQYAVSGGSLDAEATRQIAGAFSHGLDDLALAASVANARKIDATGGVTVDGILDEAATEYGELLFNGDIAALAIHPSKFGQLRKDPNFEPVASYATPVVGSSQGTTYGANEVGRLYGQIPVVIFNKVSFDATAGAHNNILIPKQSVLSVIGKDINVERTRISNKRATEITADIFVGISAIGKKALVFQF